MWGCECGAYTPYRAPTTETCTQSVYTNYTQRTKNVYNNQTQATKRAPNKSTESHINSHATSKCLNRVKTKNSKESVYKNDSKHINIEQDVCKNGSRTANTKYSTCKNDTSVPSVNSVYKNDPSVTTSVNSVYKNNSGVTDGAQSVYKHSRIIKSVCSVYRYRLGASRGFLLLFLLVLLSLRGSAGTVSLGAQLVCAKAPGLTEKQRALCRASPAAMAAIADGLRMAYAECRSQLSGRRWNCSGVGDGNHFGHVMPLATREAAFTYAITSAGVTHALSEACARGDLPACGCNNRRRMVSAEQWEWSGARCGEAAYGARLARRFLDARELERDARAVMNVHNNRLGRKIVKELVRRECKCHGVSGSCAVRTCWRALPHFRAVGAALREKYTRAKQVTPIERATSVDGRVNIQLVVKRARQPLAASRAARKSELVFLAPSPAYCERDAAAGALGTHARRCNNTSRGEDGCESLCCGRGYSTVRRAVRAQCRCQFHWCCRVHCDYCTQRTEHHICN